MKHLKLFENDIRKSFSDWLKNPKKPEVKREEFIYIFAKPVRKHEYFNDQEFDDSGRGLIMDVLDFIERENGDDLYLQISEDMGIDYEHLKKDAEYLEEIFSQWIKKYFKGGWDEFVTNYLTYISRIESKDYDEMLKTFNKKFKNTFDQDYDEVFRLYDLKLASEEDLYKIDKNYYYTTEGNLFFIAKVSRKLRDKEEVESIKKFIEESIADVLGEFQDEKIVHKPLPFYSEIVFSSSHFSPSNLLKLEDWKIKLVYPTNI